MLSYRHPAASCLRVMDELPSVLFQHLLEGQSLTFEPIPEPSKRELDMWANNANKVPRAGEEKEVKRPDPLVWARHLGLDAKFDLPVEADDFDRPERYGDKKIQSPHYPEELDARLRKIRAAARTAIEESGANMLYLAFGFLEWRDTGSQRAHQAPLLLMPVELERDAGKAGQYRTRIRWTGEEVQQNLSLRKKLEEFGIALPELEEDTDLEDFFTAVRKSIKAQPDWVVRRYVTLGLFEFGKILLYLDLDPSRWPKGQEIGQHPLVRGVLDGGEDRDGSGYSEPDFSDDAIRFRDLELELVDRADSSQSEALHTALAGKNLVIEGPPGTGKSQTITNLIAAALAQGKTVLFVAEKLAALEVVRRRMRELGLGEFCLELHSHKTKKTEALEDIADRLKLSASKQSAAAALQRLKERREQLSQYLDIIASNAGAMREVTVSDALLQAGRARRLLRDEVKIIDQAHVKIESATKLTWVDFIESRNRVKAFQEAYQALGVGSSAHEHPWAGVSAVEVLPQDVDHIVELTNRWADAADAYADALANLGLTTPGKINMALVAETIQQLTDKRTDFAAAEAAAARVEELLSIRIHRISEGAVQLAAILGFAVDAPLAALSEVPASSYAEGVTPVLTAHSEWLARAKNLKEELSGIFRDTAFEATPDDLEEWSTALAQRGFFRKWTKRWREASIAWEGLCRPAGRSSKSHERVDALTKLRGFILEGRAMKANERLRALLGTEACDVDFDVRSYLEASLWADQVRGTLPAALVPSVLQAGPDRLRRLKEGEGELRAALEHIARLGITGRGSSFWENVVKMLVPTPLVSMALEAATDNAWAGFVSTLRTCAELETTQSAAGAAFRQETGLHEHRWFNNTPNPSFAGVASRARRAATNPGSLTDWLDFDRVYRLSEGKPEAGLLEAAAAGRVPCQQLDIAFDYLVFDALARQAFKRAPQLLSLSGKSLDILREEYRSIDAEVMELRRAVIAAQLLKRKPPEGRFSGLKSEQTEMALIRAELAKQKRHIPLRQLVARAGRALQALKPCFMMGPLSVAQYIAPGSLKFDLVIMDEASQMRPEDAVGALARGGQAIIVGDPKQLPPTSFFARVSSAMDVDGDEDGGLLLAEDSKSVLELASSIFDSRMLRWHYRSRHESLIAFSNREFYKDQLIVFPSPAIQAGRYGIGWTHIPEGVATSGVNSVEARKVAEAAARILMEHQGRSLGIVAMNVKQAQRISDELAALANADRRLADAMAEAENDARGEPFFVKNLENVQGDERDIIMISMTYGPSTEAGKVPQNFGPINQDTGWRRLNVLFTRAKERMEIFSTMRSTDIVPKEGGDRGPRSLKLFLEYAETGRLGGERTISDRPTGSEFEDAVIEGLTEFGFDCVPQLGVANFFLDIAIRDPAHPGDFIAAVECDGAAYHSEKSARDRDRLRQEILENLGWNILRIWSTDWFRNPDGELQRVSDELKNLIKARGQQFLPPEVSKQIVEKSQAGVAEVHGEDGVGSSSSTPSPNETKWPSGRISADQARALLIDLRERQIKAKFPDADPTRGFLRKSMLDELLRKRPLDLYDFRRVIKLEMREATDPAQVKQYHEAVFDILARMEPAKV
jgi:very-short-patch-repair endonuclease/archaellum biogenesis ATPase FlaH